MAKSFATSTNSTIMPDNETVHELGPEGRESVAPAVRPGSEVSHFRCIGRRINRKALLPSFLKEGAAAPHQLMCRYLKLRRSGGGLYLDLNHPGRADLKVAWHLLVRRGHPSFKRRGEQRFVLSKRCEQTDKLQAPAVRPGFGKHKLYSPGGA